VEKRKGEWDSAYVQGKLKEREARAELVFQGRDRRGGVYSK